MRFTTDTVAAVTGGSVVGDPTEVSGASQDSRVIRPGQLFVPLVAERDGHDFIDRAVAAGAGAYLTQHEPVGGTAIVVPDTMVALRQLGSAARERLDCPVIGVTGSVGKTSTKDLLAGVLRQSRSTHASVRSFNNEIGVPLTLLEAPEGVEAVIVEMGARGVGHIAALCEIARPTIGVITTVAAAHTGEFGSVDAIADAKGELIDALPAGGLAVLNADVPLAAGMSSRTDADVLTFGRSLAADVRIEDLRLDDDLRARFTLASHWGRFEVSPSTRGAHLASNAAAAAAVGLWLGSTADQVAAGLAVADVSPWRMEVVRAPSGAVIINDSYNANPTSMRGALESLAALPQPRKIAVLGYMAELGAEESESHREIVAHARHRGIDLVIVGTDAYGVAPVADPIVAIGPVDGDTAVLVKGSRMAGLESVAAALAAS